MAGTRNSNLHGGTQSEYLAQYLLSSLGTVIPVPRQEDEGTDFYCSISDQEIGNVTFNHPYMIQIKSMPSDRSKPFLVSYGELNSKGTWKGYEKQWLFKQQLPLFIGLIDKEENSLRFYSTSTLWFLYHDKPNCSKIHLSCRLVNSDQKVSSPTFTKIEKWPTNSGDGFEYFVDLGNPVAKIDVNNVWDKSSNDFINIKNILRLTTHLEQKNILYRNLGIPYFNWLLDIDNSSVGTIYPALQVGKELSRDFSNILFTAVIAYRSSGEKEKLNHLKELIRLFPRDHFQEINDATSNDLKDTINFLFED